MSYFQRSVRMDKETEADIQEFADKDDRKWSEVAFLLIKSAIRERKRLAAKSKNRSAKKDEQGA